MPAVDTMRADEPPANAPVKKPSRKVSMWHPNRKPVLTDDGKQPVYKPPEEEEDDGLTYRVISGVAGKRTTGKTVTEVKGGKEVTEEKTGGVVEEKLEPAMEDAKRRGNEALKNGQLEAAAACYTEALQALAEPAGGGLLLQSHSHQRAALLSNRALANIKLQRFTPAVADASEAVKLRPDWPKPYYRVAQARMGLGQWGGAMRACRMGEATAESLGDTSREFEPLMDKITFEATERGSYAAFDGRTLEVRDAGDEAWLGLPAPEIESDKDRDVLALTAEMDPLLLIGKTSPELLTLPGPADQVALANVAALQARKLAAQEKPKSFRSLRDAMVAARDGDKIVLWRGEHNVGGDAVDVDKRVLIRGQGRLGDTKLEQRANSPALRICANCVVENLEIELLGFREAIVIEKSARPIFQNCQVSSSGDDAIVVMGKSAPLLRRCTVKGSKRAGILVLEDATGEFSDLKVEGNNGPGFHLCDRAFPKIRHCAVTKNGGEGLLLVDRARCDCTDSGFCHNESPGVDASCHAAPVLRRCNLFGNTGGVFLWEGARAVLTECKIDSNEKSVAMIVDCKTAPQVFGCTIDGEVRGPSPELIAEVRDGNRVSK